MTESDMLVEAQAALHALLLGKKVVSVSKDGRQVQYTPASVGELRSYIYELKGRLGLQTGRLPPAGVRL